MYRGKRCGTCHGSAEAGKLVAPPLAAVIEKLQTPLGIISHLWNTREGWRSGWRR